MISNPLIHATHSLYARSGWSLTVAECRIRSVSFPPCDCVWSVGLLRQLWSFGSKVLIVLEKGLVLTMPTIVRPTQTPDFKNEVPAAILIHLSHCIPVSRSIASSAS